MAPARCCPGQWVFNQFQNVLQSVGLLKGLLKKNEAPQCNPCLCVWAANLSGLLALMNELALASGNLLSTGLRSSKTLKKQLAA